MMNCLDNWVLYMCSLCTVHTNYMFRPLAHRGNAVNLEDKTKEIFSSGNWDLFSCKKCYCSVLQIGCISTDMQGVYTRVVHIFIKLHFVHRLLEMVKATHSFIGSNMKMYGSDCRNSCRDSDAAEHNWACKYKAINVDCNCFASFSVFVVKAVLSWLNWSWL